MPVLDKKFNTMQTTKLDSHWLSGNFRNCEATTGNGEITIKGEHLSRTKGNPNEWEYESFEKTFEVGHEVVHDSYNLKYVGTIKSIGAKTVTVLGLHKNSRLKLDEFLYRNWNYCKAEIEAYNAAEMQCI